MARTSELIISRASIESWGSGLKRPMEPSRNRITSSWVNQQNSAPLWPLIVDDFCCCFLLEMPLLFVCSIGTTRFCAPWSMRSMASNKLKHQTARRKVNQHNLVHTQIHICTEFQASTRYTWQLISNYPFFHVILTPQNFSDLDNSMYVCLCVNNHFGSKMCEAWSF